MIFSELYGAYYNIMADILKIAVKRPPTAEEISKIIAAKGFAETNLFFDSSLYEDRYRLMTKDGITPIHKAPSMPYTTEQKRWLKAVSLDPRFTLFDAHIDGIDDVKPLFTPDMVDVFDKYADGDPYEDETYRAHFKTVLGALREGKALAIDMISGKGKKRRHTIKPICLEYSEKDDKFRVIGQESKHALTVNINRILNVSAVEMTKAPTVEAYLHKNEVTIELINERKALDRVLLHFVHLEKEAVRLDKKRYRIKLKYDPDDETEMIIRLLSFGPLIKVTEPSDLILKLKKRIDRQHNVLPT